MSENADIVTAQVSADTGMTVSGSLPLGIVVDGVRHCKFVLRLASVDDNFYALEQVGVEAGDDLVGPLSNAMRIGLAMFSRQLLSLGGIPLERIDYAFLRQHLAPTDYDVLWEANESLKKKRNALPEYEATSGPSPLSSGSVPA